MARKGWGSLSPGYRGRLERAGVTQADYEALAPLAAARGHAKTPEHATAKIDKAKYPDYFNNRQSLIQQVQDKKERMFSGSPRWSAARSLSHIRSKPLTNKQLQWFMDASEEDILDAIREDRNTFYFVGYH